jgi:hypothetical protein
MDTNRIPKQALQYKPKDDQERDGGTNFIRSIKKQETSLNLQGHDGDDDDDKIQI